MRIQKRIKDPDNKQQNKKGRVPCLFCLVGMNPLEASTIVAVVSTTAAKDEQDDPDAVASVATSAVSIKETTVSATAAKQ